MCEGTRLVKVFGHIPNDLGCEYWDRSGWVWHTVPIDACIADLVGMLNKQGIYTLASCCGHRAKGGIAILEEDVERIIGIGYEVGIGPDGWPWAVQV